MKNGFNEVFVIIDQFTKLAHFVPTTTRETSIDTANLFYAHVKKEHGLSKTIVVDPDP